jgi:uncharacterized sulfatase
MAEKKMIRRIRAARIIMIISATLVLLITATGGIARAARPNIVIFIADDHSLRDSSVYGARDVRTPNMQRIAAQGLTFERAFVASPSCAPSRAALLTGLMPARNGAEPNHSKPRPELKKLPAYLQELGYEVVAFGKVSHYQHTKDYGFDHFAHDKFHEDVAVSAGIDWLRTRKNDKPLCLFVGTNWPHVPWPREARTAIDPATIQLPPNQVDTPVTRAARARYYEAVARMDGELGAVFDAANEVLGKENTFFLATADHGAQWPFAKWNCYDAGIRCPMIAVWPGHVAQGRRTSAMVSWIDILPTLIEVGGGAPPKSPQIDGRSFAAVLRGETDAHRDRIFTTHSGDGRMNVYPMRSVRSADWKYIRNLHPEFEYTTHIDLAKPDDGAGYFSTWRKKAKTDPRAAEIVQRYRQRPAEELYDVRADPEEQTNLAADPKHASELSRMRTELDAWMKEQGDSGRVYGTPRLLKGDGM